MAVLITFYYPKLGTRAHVLESLEGSVAELLLRENCKAVWQERSYSFVVAHRS